MVVLPTPNLANMINSAQISGSDAIKLLTEFLGRDEEEEVTAIFIRFESISDLAKLNIILRAKLKHEALKYVNSNDELVKTVEFKILKRDLIEKFSPEENCLAAQNDFFEVKQKRYESVKAFRHRIIMLANKYI